MTLFWTYVSVLLLDAALAQIHLNCQKRLEAGIGETVILSCATEPQISLGVIEWMRNETEVHVYRKGGDDLKEQGKNYKEKTSVFKQELSTGNCSLQLKVSQSHAGTYQCFVREGGKEISCSIELIVRANETTGPPLNNTMTDNPNISPVVIGVFAAAAAAAAAVVLAVVLAVVCYLRGKKKTERTGEVSPTSTEQRRGCQQSSAAPNRNKLPLMEVSGSSSSPHTHIHSNVQQQPLHQTQCSSN